MSGERDALQCALNTLGASHVGVEVGPISKVGEAPGGLYALMSTTASFGK